MTFEEVLARFPGAKRSGDGFVARCPAHEDQRASLSITGAAERTLLHCHAGCAPEDVAGAASLSLADLFEDTPSSNGKPSILAEYDYTDEAGALLYQAVRYQPKDFRQRRPDGRDGWLWKLGDVRRVPYRLPRVLDAALTGRVVFVVEGEKDVHALESIGLTATCNAGGAGKWTPELSEHLRGARVVVLPDNDGPGRKHAHDVAEKLHGVASEVRVVDLPGIPPKGDASDWLTAGGTRDQLKELVKSAPLWPSQTAEATPPAQEAVRPLVRTLAAILADPKSTEPPVVVVPRLAWRGRVTLFAAREKAGKSTTAGAAAAVVSRGAPWLGDTTDPGDVLLVCLEEHVGDVAIRQQEWGAHPDRVHVLDDLSTAGNPLKALHGAISELRPALVVVDTLAALVDCLSARPDPGSSTAWTPIMASLTRIARETDAAVVLLHHARKSDGAYRDSSAIGAGVDAILEMSEDGQDADVRKIKVRARWKVGDYAIRQVGTRYELSTGEMSLDARVLLRIQAHPGCSLRQVRDGVAGKAEEIGAAVKRLVSRGAVIDQGGAAGMKLSPADSGNHSGNHPGSHENPQGTATEPPSGTTRFPFAKPLGGDREPPTAGLFEDDHLEAEEAEWTGTL